MKFYAVVAVAILLGACARASTMPLSADMVQITSNAAPVCGAAGAQNMAVRQAAVETIRRGFDTCMIVGGQYQANTFVAGYTPTYSNTTGSADYSGNRYGGVAHGHSTTVTTGGAPIVMTAHNQGVVVKMFKEGDPEGAKAISARGTLGSKWQEAVASDKLTCLND